MVNLTGKGVGFAIDTGHQEIMKLLDKPFVSVVVAGDGQMNPEDLDNVIEPIINNQCDYVKGNRFHQRWRYRNA